MTHSSCNTNSNNPSLPQSHISAPLVVKKLRYIARFVVVALLLNRGDVVKILHETLTGLVEEYNQAFKPADYSDWKVVLSEISTFIEVL